MVTTFLTSAGLLERSAAGAAVAETLRVLLTTGEADHDGSVLQRVPRIKRTRTAQASPSASPTASSRLILAPYSHASANALSSSCS